MYPVGEHCANVVYHNIDEETLLLSYTPSADNGNFDAQSIKVFLATQKRVYSAITLADVFQKVVFTTIVTSFLVYASSNLGLDHVHLLHAYFIFTITLWLSVAFINIFIEYVLSRRTAIVIGFSSYFFGVAILSAITSPFINISMYTAIIPLYLVCLGEGFCKSFIGEFGHYQFEDVKLCEELRSYTDVMYWVGNTCAVFLIVLLLAICEIANYEIAMGICCVCIVAGVLSFLLGWKMYRGPREKTNNVFSLLFSIISDAKRVGRLSANENTSDSSRILHWLDFAKIENGGNHCPENVDEAKSFLKMTAMFFSLIPYWICNSQGYSTFIYQGFHLDIDIGDVVIPVSWTALFNIAAGLIFLKVSEKYIYPALRRNGYSVPMIWRVIIGLLITTLSMCSAGAVQLYAHEASINHGTQLHEISNVNMTYVREVHILWTIPQYVFLGISEVLVGLTCLSLACKLCPSVFKKLVTSMYYLTIAIGHALSVVLLSVGWFPVNRFLIGCEMVIYFFSLAGLAMFGVCIFVYAITEKGYKKKNTNNVNA